MDSLTTRADLIRHVAGEVESFESVDTLSARIRAEHSSSSPSFDEGAFLESSESLVADGTALHMPFNPTLMGGDLQVYRPYPGVLVFSVDFVANDPGAMHAISKTINTGNKGVSVRFFHSGKIRYRFGDRIFDSEELPGIVSYVIPGGHFDYQVEKGKRIQLSNFIITEEGEREVWHRLGIPPCSLFHALRENEDPTKSACPLPNTEAFAMLGESLRHMPRSGFAQNAMLRMKVGELFCLLSDVDNGPHSPAADEVPFSEVRKLSQARTILDESIEDPPSIAELGAMVGLNRRKLTEGFKKVFGETVAGYALELRMRKGDQLLRETEFSISEIAEMCGYEHANNFTLAFRRRFGASPSKVRESN